MNLQSKIVENTWLKGMDHGWGNGYVALPKEHKYFGVDYDNIPVSVHGGLTFAELITPEDKHFPEFLGMWVVGFDTAHWQDTADNWPKKSVKAETDRLRKQLEAII